MNTQPNVLQVYKDLAQAYERRGQAQMRDRFYVLAADAARSSGLVDEAETLRLRLLQANPHHMLKPYDSFADARTAPDVDTYISNLRQNYPLEVAVDLLRAINASGNLADQKMQQTAPLPRVDFAVEDATLQADGNNTPQETRAWDPHEGNSIEETAALPFAPPGARPSRKIEDINQTAPLTGPGAPRPRAPMKADIEQTEPAARLPSARTGPAPRSAAPSSMPARPMATSKPVGSSRPVAPRAPSRPAATASPFAPPLREPTRSPAARNPYTGEEVPEGNSWLSSVLLVFVALIAVSVLGYVIARPFLP